MELSNEFEVSVPIAEAWAVLTDVERIAPCLPGAQLQEVEGDDYRGVVKVKVGPISAQYKGAAHFVEKDDANYRAVLSASGRDTRGQGNASASITAELTAKGDITHVSVLTDLTITGKVAQFGRGVIGDVSVKLLDQFVENLESTVLTRNGGTDADSLDRGDQPDDRENRPDVRDDRPDDRDDDVTQLLATELTKVWGDRESGTEAVRAARPALAPRPDLLAVEQGLTVGTEPAPVAARRIDSPEAQPIDLFEAAGTPVLKRLLPLAGLALVAIVVVAILRRRRR